ncbi:MAG: hypothetical protein FD161_4599 [Limisphaerales bacterium]|nr:MAG: hypothetical protein FD161_4599 [Limisphaerales bacterium]KAG0506797.1 MAG: hypothetical protein E1N63_4040 [Limisphaerales bacterium]TXT44984.1 MAG: hypothetical protein FD140_4783 [Limisphaerales bacterium]
MASGRRLAYDSGHMNLALASLMMLLLSGALASAATVARWDFGAEEPTRLTPHGGVHRDVPGPRPPEFPDFDAGNTAVQLDGNGARFTFDDPGGGSGFDFTNGDAITLEAWVKLDDLRPGENLYVIGKGRTGAAGFTADNQNWALRVREQRGRACVSFLFATVPVSGTPKSDQHWHRWTTAEGFAPKSGWHHIALTYRFGEPASVRGWLDGQSLPGAWDIGGPTTAPPVVDNDAVWIGSSSGGAPANSFRGALDAVAVHRGALPDEMLKQRFRRTGGPVVTRPAKETLPDLGALPLGRVRVTFHEKMPAHDRWLNDGEVWPDETARWDGESFLLPRLPVRYDDWGIREAWKAPLLVRLAADVTLPPGKQRFVMRARALGRLWVNGVVVARTAGLTKSPPDGEEPMTPVAQPPLPGVRPAAYWQQETFGEAEIPADGKCRIVLETVVGGPRMRAETSELCAAVQTADGKSFNVLQPTGISTPLPLRDAAVHPALARMENELTRHDDATRRTAAASRADFWRQRHELARQWARQQPAPAVPKVASHPIDAFLADKIQKALADSAKTPPETAKQFHAAILPILRDECFRCHGEKEKGGLRLNSRAAALKAGESEKPAVVPGNLAASELIRRLRTKDESERMPPRGAGLKPEQIAALENWVKQGALWPAPPLAPAEVAASAPLDDAAFLRRLSLDTVGVPPGEAELRAFLADRAPDKRPRAIDRLLADERWADHWMGYWLDVLAENPALINASLNSTGPFRWFLHDALRDNQPLDRFVTELILLRGSPHTGGSAGFGLAGENDAPFATKGQVIASAFLGIELQCARCHDSPYHSTKQRDLYALAAMFERKTVTVPKTSMVPAAFFEKQVREPLIKATLKPGEPVAPVWPFAAVTGSSDADALQPLLQSPTDSRERLAALITAPQNTRFAQVMVNRVWRRFMGAGLVEPVADWEGRTPSHPALLDWLAREFITHGYDVKHVARLILTSRTYQRAATGNNLAATADLRFFNAPERRRLSAEQVVDSLFAATGQRMDVEEITFDPTGRRDEGKRITLGLPTRAWMLCSLTNERDRPSLSLPRAQAVCDVLEAFGWNGNRQSPRTDRETAPNVLQPGVLANSMLSVALSRAAHRSPLADLAVGAPSPEALVESVFLRFLSRLPGAAERTRFADRLRAGFADRLMPAAQVRAPEPLPPLPRVTWYNHQLSEANRIAQELERRARLGPPPDLRLNPGWRETFEDFVWSVMNTREFVWLP